MEMSGQLHAPAPVTPGKEPLVSIGSWLGGPQSRSWRGGEKKKYPYPYRESNPGHPTRDVFHKINFLLHYHCYKGKVVLVL